MLVFKDVLRLADDEADAVRAWMIGALVAAARAPAQGQAQSLSRA